MKLRLTLLLSLVVMGAFLIAPAAQAQSPRKGLTQVVAFSGKTKSGKSVRGSYAINRFTRARSGRYRGKLVSVGTLRTKTRRGRITKRNVVMPARASGPATAAQGPGGLPPLPGGPSCRVLALDLGPINLNLLGLVVRTNQIQLRIDAVQGPGNLLGNLLCGITGILDPQGTSAGTLSRVLNAILALVPRTA
jgi:hypothetical protein